MQSKLRLIVTVSEMLETYPFSIMAEQRSLKWTTANVSELKILSVGDLKPKWALQGVSSECFMLLTQFPTQENGQAGAGLRSQLMVSLVKDY